MCQERAFMLSIRVQMNGPICHIPNDVFHVSMFLSQDTGVINFLIRAI